MFATYRVKAERIILFVKIMNRYFERKECFSAVTVPKFWRFCKNQGRKTENWENFSFMLCTSQIEPSTSPPQAYPGHLTPFPAWEGGNLIILVFPDAGHLITTQRGGEFDH